MKFSEIKIGQEFKRTVKNILFIKIAKNKYAYNDEVSTIADVNEEVELISKCNNCEHYSEDGNCSWMDFYIPGNLHETFNCSEFEKKEGV